MANAIVPSWQGDPLDPLGFFGPQPEPEGIEIVLHVAGVGGPCKRHHAHLESEPEDDLGDVPAVASGDAGELRMSDRLAVCGQEREALVDEPARGAERADVAVPAA